MDVKEQLQRQNPNWRLWRSKGGSWVATRRTRMLTEQEVYAGLCQTLIEDDAERLDAALAGQAEIEGTLS